MSAACLWNCVIYALSASCWPGQSEKNNVNYNPNAGFNISVHFDFPTENKKKVESAASKSDDSDSVGSKGTYTISSDDEKNDGKVKVFESPPRELDPFLKSWS